MEKKAGIRQYLNLLALFAITALMLAFTMGVRNTDEAGVRLYLPDHAGEDWRGYDVLFCHSRTCDRSWLVKDLPEPTDGEYFCPRDYTGAPCGGKLHPMAKGEWDVLPKDTTIFKKQYFHRDVKDRTAFVAVVLSGSDRSSIHRPQLCLVGQGNEIVNETVIDVPIPGRPPLKVMVLNLIKSDPRGQGTGGKMFSYYAYWFVGKDRETASHSQRMLYMGFDRLFRNVAHRWAYISVSGLRPDPLDDSQHHEIIRDIVSKLYPEISLIKK